MNLNKTLAVVLSILILLVVVTIINLNRSKNPSSFDSINLHNEVIILNSRCVPDIVRSYERVKDIYGIKNILFFRFANNSCNSCLDSQLNELLSFQEEVGKEKIWVFPAYPDDRNSRIQLGVELAKFNFRNIPADSLYIPAYGGEHRSYFAWITNEGSIDMVFVPERSNVHHTRQYFLEIKKIMQKIDRVWIVTDR